MAPAQHAHKPCFHCDMKTILCPAARPQSLSRAGLWGLLLLLAVAARAATSVAAHEQGPSVSFHSRDAGAQDTEAGWEENTEGSSASSSVSGPRRILREEEAKGHLGSSSFGKGGVLLSDAQPTESCDGRRVFILDLPSEFTEEQLKTEDPILSNYGFRQASRHLTDSAALANEAERIERAKAGEGANSTVLFNSTVQQQQLLLLREAREHLGRLNASFGPSPLYWTHTFSLDRIVYYRIQSYPCIVPTYEEADAIYIPQLLRNGQDPGRGRGESNRRLEAAVTAHPAWKRKQGRDMFTVVYMTMWNYHNKAFMSPVLNSLTKVTIEANRWVPRSVGVPYPSELHLRSKQQLQAWQAMVGSTKRPFLFTLYGSPDVVSLSGRMLRRVLSWQCSNSPKCLSIRYQRRGGGSRSVFLGQAVLPLYMFASFCLQPHGDTCTRKGIINSILAGCIPVVFETCALETQWLRLLPPERRFQRFFVRIPLERLQQPPGLESVPACAGRVKGDPSSSEKRYSWPQEQVGEGYDCLEDPLEGGINPTLWVQQVLEAIPPQQVEQMRRNVVDLIPWVQYGGVPREPTDGGGLAPPNFPDALDLVIQAAIEQAGQDRQDEAVPVGAGGSGVSGHGHSSATGGRGDNTQAHSSGAGSSTSGPQDELLLGRVAAFEKKEVSLLQTQP